MKDIYVLKSGESVPAKIERMFQTHGPFTIEGRRLDFLIKVNVLVDSSTSVIQTTGTSTSKAKTGSMVGRAVVGGVLTGGTGAIIGGLSAKRDSDTNTISSEVKQTEITAELIFEGETSLYVVIRSIEAFHWLLSFAGQKPLTDEELEIERNKAEELKELQLQRDLEALRKISQNPKSQAVELNKIESKYSAEFIFVFVLFMVLLFGLGGSIYKEYSSKRSLRDLPVIAKQSVPVPDVEDELNKYVADLVARTGNNINSPEILKTTPNTWVIHFQTSDKNFKANANGDTDQEAFNRNQALVAKWTEIFCTPELKFIISYNKLLFVTGSLKYVKSGDSISRDDLAPLASCSDR